MSSTGVCSSAYNGAKDLGCAQAKVDQFLLEWLSLEETQSFVASLSDNSSGSLQAIESGTEPLVEQIFPGAPPVSPRTASPRSHFSPRKQNPFYEEQPSQLQNYDNNLRNQTDSSVQEQLTKEVPQFYHPKGAVSQKSAQFEIIKRIKSEYKGLEQGQLSMERFVPFIGEMLELPEIVGIVLYWKLQDGNGVPLAQLQSFLDSTGFIAMDLYEKVFQVIKSDTSCNFLVENDLRSLVRAALDFHPGLEFLRTSPEFQQRYADTVVYRILYDLGCRPEYDRIYLRSLKSNQKLVTALQQLDDDVEINRELHYFSYEHFYVIYCKFWELDQDQDMQLSQDDLLIYSSCALTYKIAQRIFQGIPKQLEGGANGSSMGYKDFVWFVLSEEDKTSETAVDYWFRCIDLDGDGYINDHDIRYFYDEQYSRMECMNQETVKVEDVLAQMSDMLQPKNPLGITRKDLLRQGRLVSSFFDILFNVHKFWTLENQDPFSAKQERGDYIDLTDWQIFAAQEYARMMFEEDCPTS